MQFEVILTESRRLPNPCFAVINQLVADFKKNASMEAKIEAEKRCVLYCNVIMEGTRYHVNGLGHAVYINSVRRRDEFENEF